MATKKKTEQLPAPEWYLKLEAIYLEALEKKQAAEAEIEKCRAAMLGLMEADGIKNVGTDLTTAAYTAASMGRRFNSTEFKQRYDEMVAGIESAKMYDGRNKGVDVYICNKCGHKFYTRYKDKGVTPFTIKCRHCEHGTMMHDQTIPELVANFMAFEVHNWVCPTFEQFQTLSEGAQKHVLNGGLMLEDELDNGVAKFKKEFDKAKKIKAQKKRESAVAVLKSIQKEYAKGIIKDFEVPPLVNTKTLEDVGFAVILYLASKYDYNDTLLNDWKERLNADEYSISAKQNRLQIKFTIRY